MSPMETLIYCLDILKIKESSEIYRNALDLVQKVPLESVNEGKKGISNAMKIIVDTYSSSLKNNNSNNDNNNNSNTTDSYIFSQSQMSDFLTLSAKGIEDKRMNSQIIRNVVFKMYRDIMENYENFSHSLKSNYPRIIVDVISIINHDVDTKGSRVSSIGIEKYYLSRKQQAAAMPEEEGWEEQKAKLSAASSSSPTAAVVAAAAAAIHKEKILLLSKKDLIETLSQITNRERKELEESVARLQYSDLKKISELCRNYSKLQYYSKLITKEGSQEEFKNEIERELGRKPRSHQLGRAANSIRRVRTYIENILDNKFTPDTSHGINHVKHNLEYGYQLMNLIERPRRRTQRIWD
jgi:hypothetical protein